MVKVKRYVQRKLFSKVNKTKTILGLAGKYPEQYLEVLPYHKKVVLVDYNPVNPTIIRNSLVGEFDLLSNQASNYSPITLVDCDFCKSIVKNGDDFIYIYNKMKKNLVRNKYISFTFSLRGVGLVKTVKFLKQFEELNTILFTYYCKKINLDILQKRQYIIEFYNQDDEKLDLYMYRDSGDNMISGIIKLL